MPHDGKQKRLEFEAPSEEVVAKANDFVRSRHDLSVLEHKVIVALVADLDRVDNFPVQTVRIRELSRRANLNADDLYDRVQDVCDNLRDQSIDMHDFTEDGNPRYTTVNCFSMCQHVKGSGAIRARFTKDMRPFLANLKNRFTLYLLTVFLRMSSKHSARIYELLKMRQGIRALNVSVQEFRSSLALTDKYDHFSHLKRSVIEVARKELAQKADIQFTYKVCRDGRTPTDIVFYIHPNDEVIEELEHSVPELSRERDQKERSPGENPPGLDVEDLFLSRLTQEEIESITEEEIRNLRTQARQGVGGDGNSPSAAFDTATRMKKIWRAE